VDFCEALKSVHQKRLGNSALLWQFLRLKKINAVKNALIFNVSFPSFANEILKIRLISYSPLGAAFRFPIVLNTGTFN